jgi:hypothetical protein
MSPVWSKTDRKLFYGTHDGIMVVSYTSANQAFATTTPTLWAEKTALGAFDVAARVSRFAVVQDESIERRDATQVTFLLNFFSELHRRVGAAR